MIINKLKTFAFAMMAAGATVTVANAATDYSSTNVLQPVTAALTVYEEATGSQSSVATGAAAKITTANLISAVEAGLGGKNILGNDFGAKATLDVLTYETAATTATTNPAVTNVITNTAVLVTNETIVTNLVSSPVTLPLNTNTVELVSATTNLGFGTNILGTNGVSTNSIAGTNGGVVLATNDVTLGNTSGDYVTITGTNGSTNLIVNTVNPLTGPTTNTYATNSFTYDANQTAIIGTNTPIPVETNSSEVGYTGTPGVTNGTTTNVAIDASSLVIETNGVALTNFVIGTNTYTVSTNSVVSTNGSTNTLVVTVGTNTVTLTNSTVSGTNAPVVVATNTVEIVSADSTNIVVGTNEAGGFTNADTLTTVFTVVSDVTNVVTNTTFTTNLNGTTNVITVTNQTISTNLEIVTETASYSTATNIVTNFTTNFLVTTNITPATTNAATNIVGGPGSLVIAEVVGTGASATPVYTPVPAAILSITNPATTNDILADTKTVISDWTIKQLILNTTTNATTNAVTTPITLTLQGLVHSTRDNFSVASALTVAEHGKITVTNEAWTDVTGYGIAGTTPLVVGGTVTVGTPVASKVPQ